MVSTDVVTLRRWAFWFSTAGQHQDVIAWRDGMTLEDVVPSDLRGRDDLRVMLNGVRAPHLGVRVSPRDQVDVAIRPDDGGAISGALIQAAVSALVATGVSLIVSLLARPKGPKKRKDDESDSTAWSGPSNTRVEGQPRMRVYGLVRVAPQIIDEFARCRNTPGQEDLWQLFSFGEGPITEICGISSDTATARTTGDTTNPIPVGAFVGDNRLETLREVEMHVRMGTNEQDPIPGFEELYTDYVVDQELKQEETNSTSNTTLNAAVDPALVAYDADNGLPNSTDSANAQAVWTKHAVRFVMELPADAATLVIGFPGGLNRITNSSGLADAGFQMAIRYREVDAFGSPITIGGNRNNGWVYQRPDQIFLSRNQREFAREYSFDFYNPQGYTPATQGKCLDCSGGSKYASIASPTLPASWATATDLDGFTVEGWFRLWQLPTATGGGDTHRPIFEWSDGTSTNNRGFGLSIEAYTNAFTSALQWVPVGFAGTPNGLRRIEEAVGTGPTRQYVVDANPSGWSSWHHAAFTYEKSPASGITARFRVFLDNQLVKEQVYSSSGNDHVQGCSSDPFEFMRSLRFVSGSTVYGNGALDEFRVWDHAKDARAINAIWNGGEGKFGTDTNGLVCGFHYDTTSSPTTDYSTNATPATLNGGASVGSVAGWVWTNPTGTLKRMRAEIECLRLNVLSNSNRVQDESRWMRLFGRVKAQLAYPNQPLVGLRRRANDSGEVTFLAKGLSVPVWDGLSVEHPAITMRWESPNFRPPPGRNTAWIGLDLATNPRCALSRDFGFGRVSLPDFFELAAYCDELVYDGKGARQAIHETDNTKPVYDLRYNSTLFGAGQPGIEIFFRTTPTVFEPPRHWKVGGFLGFTGLPTSSGVAVDINTSAIDGFQISEVVPNTGGGGWIIRVRYDATTHGAPWTDGQFLSTVYTGGTLTGTVEGREPRFQFDRVFDTFSGAWEDLVQLLATCRAAPIKEGSTLRIRIERPRAATCFLCNANTLIAGEDDEEEPQSSFEIEYLGTLDRPTKYHIEFSDEEQNYRWRTARVPFPGTDPRAVSADDIIDDIRLEGVTRRSQVVRHGSFMLLVNRYLTRQMSLTAGLDTLGADAGAVTNMANDLVPWGTSGKVVSASSTTQLVLDRPITVPASPTMYLRIRFNASGQVDTGSGAGDHVETLAITSSSGTYAAGATIAVATGYSRVPEKGDLWVAFTAAQERKGQIIDIDLQPDLRRKMEIVDYDERVYDVDDLEADVPVF